MARVTVEDCLKQVPNRFEVVIVATERTKELNSGAEPSIGRSSDKNTVIALRELASGKLNIQLLKDKLITSLQDHEQVDQVEEGNLSIPQENISSAILPESNSDNWNS